MVEGQYAVQPQPIAAAEMAGAEDDKRGRKGSAYEYKRVPNPIAEATRAREPRRVWAGSSPYGASAFRNLRSGLPSGYGVGEKLFARPEFSVLRENRPRSSVRQQDFRARSLTSHHHVSCKQCVCAETRIVAAVAPAVTAARSDGRHIVESEDRLQQRTALRSRHWISLDVTAASMLNATEVSGHIALFISGLTNPFPQER